MGCIIDPPSDDGSHNGIKTVEEYMDPLEDRTEVAAGISVQSRYYMFWDNEDNWGWLPFTSSYGIAQVTDKQMEEYGLTCDQDDPDCAIQAMAIRIDRVLKHCEHCSSYDLLIAAALAQNGGFPSGDMASLNVDRVEGEIDWSDYFNRRRDGANISMASIFQGVDHEIYDTRFMVLRYTEDLIELNNRGWTLPWDLTVDEVITIQDQYGGR